MTKISQSDPFGTTTKQYSNSNNQLQIWILSIENWNLFVTCRQVLTLLKDIWVIGVLKDSILTINWVTILRLLPKASRYRYNVAMIQILQSAILGAIQGIAEFLPISSSGHLRAIPYIFSWPANSLSFDVALHLGTAIAILIFFWKDWLHIIFSGLKIKSNTKFKPATIYPQNTLWQIALATIPAVIAGIFLSDFEDKFGIVLVAINLAVFGLVLWLVDKRSKTDKDTANITYKQSFIIGLSQALALIPGISRSGITMVASRAQGFTRESAARFSFLLGTPATIGAFVFQARDLTTSDLTFSFFIGILVSALAGIIAIKFLLDFLKKSDFSIFAYYRFLLAAVILIIYFAR